jgi:hypothetical protein
MYSPKSSAYSAAALKAAFALAEVRLRRRRELNQGSGDIYVAAWSQLLSTMAPQHAAMVSTEYGAFHNAWVTIRGDWNAGRPESISRPEPLSKLTHKCSDMVDAALGGYLRGPFAMPREVCEVYLKDPDAIAIHDCEDCGYEVPLGCPLGKGNEPTPTVRRYFTQCPICGGKTGWYAYLMAHPSEMALNTR